MVRYLACITHEAVGDGLASANEGPRKLSNLHEDTKKRLAQAMKLKKKGDESLIAFSQQQWDPTPDYWGFNVVPSESDVVHIDVDPKGDIFRLPTLSQTTCEQRRRRDFDASRTLHGPSLNTEFTAK